MAAALRFLKYGLVAAAVLAVAPQVAEGQQGGELPSEDVTFTRDVAPIIYENCLHCHRQGSVAPMAFGSFRDVRRYARRIKDQVRRRLMPPYHYDTGVGIQNLANDWRLTDAEVETITAWVDAGTPEGDPADLPNPPMYEDRQIWQQEALLGPPDHIVRSLPFDVPSEGGDTWWRPVVPTGIDSERWIRAMEVRPSYPGGRQVVHHGNPRLDRLNEETGEYERMGNLSEYAMGKIGEVVPEDAGRLIKPTDRISWDIHYYPMGFEVPDDVLELGIWFYPEGYEPEFTQNLRLYPLQGDIALEPGGTAMTQGFYRWDHPVRIDSFQPHGHMHLAGMSLQAIYPDGRRELISMVSDFDARWHHSYIYEDDEAPLLPAGTVIVMTGWYENSDRRPLVDPTVWAARGSRSFDEMSHAWIAVTHLDEQGFEKIKEDRERARVVSQQEEGGEG